MAGLSAVGTVLVLRDGLEELLVDDVPLLRLPLLLLALLLVNLEAFVLDPQLELCGPGNLGHAPLPAFHVPEIGAPVSPSSSRPPHIVVHIFRLITGKKLKFKLKF